VSDSFAVPVLSLRSTGIPEMLKLHWLKSTFTRNLSGSFTVFDIADNYLAGDCQAEALARAQENEHGRGGLAGRTR